MPHPVGQRRPGLGELRRRADPVQRPVHGLVGPTDTGAADDDGEIVGPVQVARGRQRADQGRLGVGQVLWQEQHDAAQFGNPPAGAR